MRRASSAPSVSLRRGGSRPRRSAPRPSKTASPDTGSPRGRAASNGEVHRRSTRPPHRGRHLVHSSSRALHRDVAIPTVGARALPVRLREDVRVFFRNKWDHHRPRESSRSEDREQAPRWRHRCRARRSCTHQPHEGAEEPAHRRAHPKPTARLAEKRRPSAGHCSQVAPSQIVVASSARHSSTASLTV